MGKFAIIVAGYTQWQLALLAKQIGLNISGLDDDEIRVLMRALEKSEKLKQGRKRR